MKKNNKVLLPFLLVFWNSLFASIPSHHNDICFENRFKRFVFESLNFIKKREFSLSKDHIDIFIATIDKDFDVLPEVIRFAKINILHPVDNIYICSRHSQKVIDICDTFNCIFINEDQFGFKKDDIDYFPLGVDRRGWLFQQLLKLCADTVCENDNILILDSDTLFIEPINFIDKGKFVFSCSDEFHLPYRECFKKILNFSPKSEFSFVSHYMLFNRKKLQILRNYIEKENNKIWYNAIIDSALKSDTSGFSEYETYGNFVEEFFPEEIKKIYWFNKSFPKSNLNKFLKKRRSEKIFIQSASFHSYL